MALSSIERTALWRSRHPERAKESHAKTYRRQKEKIIAKRIPCACGCGEFLKTPRKKYAGPGHNLRGKEKADVIRASVRPTIADLKWVAGFLEGEGSFVRMDNHGAKTWNSAMVSCRQVQRWPLDELQKFLGGPVTPTTHHKSDRRHFENSQPATEWHTTGLRARGVMMTIYSFMSPKRKEQIEFALGGNKWR